MKSDLRAEVLARRSAVPPAERLAFAERLATLGPGLVRDPRRPSFDPVVALYLPIKDEADPSRLLAVLSAAGLSTALPVTVARGTPLVFRAWVPGDPLVPGPWGLSHPADTAAVVEPDILFVPLAAFDRRGARLGYGAGFYDATLEALRARKPVEAIGIAFACQEVLYLPTEDLDQALNVVVTERDIILCGRLMRLLFVGDVMGRSGRAAIAEHLADLRARWQLDAVVVNGENAAGIAGITEAICGDFIGAGADAVTLGNHAWDQREALVFIEREPRLIRPANYPKGTPGRGANLIELRNGQRLLVVNVMGRVFMDALDDPFAAVDREIEACPLGLACDAILVDMHAEATSEKLAMAHHLDGRVSVVVGTHTHVPTADHQILEGGTAYQSDAGMTGDYDSVIGVQKDEPVRRFLTKVASGRFEAALGPATLCGLAVEIDDRSGLAVKIAPLRKGGRLSGAEPDFWR